MTRRVLHLVGSFNQGGSERQAVQLARLMHEDGRVRVRVACLNRSGVLLDEMERAGTGEIPEFPLTSFYDRNAVVQLRRLARLIAREDIEVVQSHDFYTNVFGMAGAALARAPVRIAARRETVGFRTPMQKRVERAAYRLAHAVVANAEAVRAQLIAEGVPASKVEVVYNGLNTERIEAREGLKREEALALFGLEAESERRFVTIVANLRHPVKDHPTFLRAARRVREAVPDAAFAIAGEGELAGEMRELAKSLGIECDTFFTGRCERVAELLAVSEVCVLSSRAEGFSNSILEYMAAGRAVVATDVGGAREAIVEGETGHLVAAGDDEAMASRISSLLQEPERAREMGEAGRRRVREMFSCEAQLERTLELYERLLARARGALPRGAARARREGA